MPTQENRLFYDDYHECYWTTEEVEHLLQEYQSWCEQNQQIPEVTMYDFFINPTPGMLGHIAYHARLI